jgi:hypothetical protein
MKAIVQLIIEIGIFTAHRTILTLPKNNGAIEKRCTESIHSPSQ